MSSTETENKDAARQIIEETWNGGELDVVDDILSDNYVMHNPGVPGEVVAQKDLNRLSSCSGERSRTLTGRSITYWPRTSLSSSTIRSRGPMRGS